MDERVLVSIGGPTADAASMLVHPHYVLRVAGEPASKLSAIWTGKSDEMWRRLVELRELSSSLSTQLCDELAQRVPQVLDVAGRRRLLDLRRALHNGRPAKAAELEALRTCADAALTGRILELDQVHVAYAAALREFPDVFGHEMAEGARSIHALLDSKNLQLALSYNNHRLLAQLKSHYGQAAPSSDSKTVRNLEDSLLQFFGRASTKTSPLSSFTLMRVGHWQDDDGARVSRLTNRVERRVEAKAALMRHILDGWMRNYETVSRVFPLKLNPTVLEADGKLKLQVVSAGRDFIGRIWGTGVDVSSVDASPMFACVRRALEDAPDASLPIESLVDRICALAPKLPQVAVEAYVKKLYEIGYLLAQTGYVEQTDTLEWMADIGAELGDEIDGDFRAAVSRMRAGLEVMRGNDVDQRIVASSNLDSTIFDMAAAAGARIGGYLYRTPYYENCYYTGDDQDLSLGLIDAHREEFDLIQQVNGIIDANRLVHTSLCDYFVSRFGEDGVCTDIATLIEEFDLAYAPLVSEGKADAEGVAENSPRTLALLRAKRAFEDYLKQQLGQGRDIQLDPEALRGIVAMLPQGMRSRSLSYSYLVQPFKSDDAEGLVLNQIYGGRSGILSRFCEVLDQDGMAQVRAYLQKGSEAGHNAELGGVFGFNANRHPSMSDVEVVVPPFGPSYDQTRKVSLAELSLVYVPNEHRLVFRGGDGKIVDIWYHGLLTPVMLPAVQRTIALAFSEGPCFLVANAMARVADSGGSDVQYTPRLTLGNIVVSRRSWTVAHSTCPDASLPPAQFYLAIRDWQKAHGLPERFFVRAILGGSGEKTRISRFSAMKGLNFKDLKPFYVDLRNPRFVRLLQNMLKRHDLALQISELLPDFEDHASSVDDETHVSELHFELTSKSDRLQSADLRWYALRVAYFDDRRQLILGPIAEAIETAKRDFGVERAFFLPHWKFGPHIDLLLQCDSESYALRVLPAVQAIIEKWIAENPSRAQLDPLEYEKTSQWIGTSEIDSGPYLPLLKDNSVAPVPYLRPKTLLIPEVAESKELMLSDCCDLILELNRLNDVDRESFFITLHAMLAATAHTQKSGLQEGYMSMRSHADYFFAAYDSDNALRDRFDKVDEKNKEKLDKATRAVVDGRYADTGLPGPFVEILERWTKVLADVDIRSKRIVELRYDEVVGQGDQFIEMATQMRQDVPDEFFERAEKRQISEIGAAFINTKSGGEVLRRPGFLAYRINVNFFYALLPLLEIAPIQKFLLCHLLSNSVERVYGQDSREKVARIRAMEESGQ
ncbi:lantibiotic dehydratase [Lysobacter sp. cf310]|uniref:lantibiotic dehydratase n=1 Tax=Lysobacter sp. cf310 TaxID=1761790 RepID=UPI000B8870CD|nr:lantibiotic dehydratase [Lysobacter sp. cf310]